MTRIRIGLIITMILGSMYAAAGLMSTLTDFGVGVAVVAAAMVGYGLTTYIAERDTEQMQAFRDKVWARRDYEDQL